MRNAEGGAGESIPRDFLAAELAVDPSLEHRNRAVGQLDDLFHVGGDHQHGHARVLELANDVVNVAASRRVNAAGRLIENDDLRIRGQRAGDDHLLLVAAGEAADLILERNDLRSEILDVFLRDFSLTAAIHVHRADVLAAQQRGRCIGRNRADFENAVVVAVFRHEVDACLQKGMIINCTAVNVIRLVPPLIITKAEIDALMAVFAEVFAEF